LITIFGGGGDPQVELRFDWSNQNVTVKEKHPSKGETLILLTQTNRRTQNPSRLRQLVEIALFQSFRKRIQRLRTFRSFNASYLGSHRLRNTEGMSRFQRRSPHFSRSGTLFSCADDATSFLFLE
jgi:hypothetical protein